MAQYNLADNVATSFSLTLRGEDGANLEFDVKYPNTAEMRAIVKSSNDLEELLKKKATKKAIDDKGKESEDQLNKLISPVGHEFPFAEVFANQAINVQREFRKIIQIEFGGNES